MQDTLTSPGANSPAPRLSRRNLFWIAIALVALAGLAAFVFWQTRAPGRELQANGFPLNQEIEERFGIRFTFLAVTGEEALVDLRYRVVDADKADNFGHYTETSPLIVNEATGKRLEVTKMGLHNHRVEPGRTYYILYRNTDYALKSGDEVTIQIDDLKLTNIVAR